MKLTDQLANTALDVLEVAYPFAPHHVIEDAQSLQLPGDIHPAFANSFDWHSSVHMHNLLAEMLTEKVLSSPQDEAARALLQDHLTTANITREAAYLTANPSFERPYGWAWAASLANTWNLPELAEAVFHLTSTWLPSMPAPVRHGVHSNTAFALRRILLAARSLGTEPARRAEKEIEEASRRFFLTDTNWSFRQERSGHDFLSPGLAEVELMAEVLGEDEFEAWTNNFLSQLHHDPDALAIPTIRDGADGQQSHLNGLGLYLATVLNRQSDLLGDYLDGDRDLVAERLAAPGIAAATSGSFMDTHWLASFVWEYLRSTKPHTTEK